MEPISSLSDAELEAEVLTWSGRLAAGEAHLLDLIAEFDERGSWFGSGLLSCAHWLVWRTGLSPGAAREKVRVARALTDLPLVAEAMAQGRVSFSQARAVTRVATADDQVRWVELCRHTAASQLEKLVRGVARVRRTLEDEADPERGRWRSRTTTSYDDDGKLRLTMVLTAEQGAVLTAALASLQLDLERLAAEQQPPAPPKPVALVDAMVEMARRTLDAQSDDRARRTRSRLVAQVDPVSGWARLADGELLPPTSLTAVSSLTQVMRGLPGRGGSPRLRPLTPADLRARDLGRSSRLPSQGLRDLLESVDGERCRFPGCTRHRKLHAHHVVFWQQGGATDLGNLLLVCSRHHTLIHRDGFRLVLHTDRRLSVSTAAGVPVLHHPARPWADPAGLDAHASADVSAETLTPTSLTARMDLDYCVAVLLQQAA